MTFANTKAEKKQASKDKPDAPEWRQLAVIP
jgi:hypothetical protein